MSKIEELVMSAYEYGQRTELLNKVTELREEHKHMPLEEIYERAYIMVMKT